MADRIGIISRGELILVEDKATLMRKLGRKQLTLHLQEPLHGIPAVLDDYGLSRSADGMTLVYTFENEGGRARITTLLRQLGEAGVTFRDLETSQSSLEEIFVSLVRGAA
jgi:ABC-2 type transport system ATP-binding protein